MKISPALLVIDIQNDYFPGGKMELFNPERGARNAASVLQYFRENQLPVVHIAHESLRPGATFFLPNTEGQKIHPLVTPLAEEVVIVKNYPNSFLQTPLQKTLQELNANHLIITGMMTHMCIDATSRAAKDLGYGCTLVHDATATRNLVFTDQEVPAAQVQAAFMAAISAICDRVMDTGTLLQSLADQ